MTITPVKKKTVLIVESDRERANMYFRNLTSKPQAKNLVRTDVQDARAALEMLRKHHFDIVVCSGSEMTASDARRFLEKA